MPRDEGENVFVRLGSGVLNEAPVSQQSPASVFPAATSGAEPLSQPSRPSDIRQVGDASEEQPRGGLLRFLWKPKKSGPR